MTAIANLPDLRPSLLLDFANSGRVDPRIQCTRASSATCFGPDGKLRTVAANVPRIDYDPVRGRCLGLLMEEARANLLPYSGDFSGGGFSVQLATRVYGAAKGPTGAVEMVKIEEAAGNGYHSVYNSSVPFTAGQSYAFSVYAKAAERSLIQLTFGTAVAEASNRVDFDLANGVVVSQSGLSGNIVPIGDGVYRLSAVLNSALETTTSSVFICTQKDLLNTRLPSYAGEVGKGVYAWGAQLEVGAVATSYIPTTTAAVTRAADRALVPITSAAGWFNAVEGSVVVSARQTGLSEAKDRSIFALSDNSFANRVVLRGKYAGSVYGGLVVASNSVVQATIGTGNVVDRQLQKFAASFAPNSFALAVSGGLMGQDTDGAVPTGITQLVIGDGQVVGNEIINGHIANLAYYPRRLTNAELQRLTA